MPEPSLQTLQQILKERRGKRESAPGQDIGVDREGRIVIIRVNPDGTVVAERPTSRVPKEIFASDYSRLIREQSFVTSKMPSNTYRVNEKGVEGWMYEINTGVPYYDDYTLFLYYDSGYYYVTLVDPPYAGQYDVTKCHLFSSGRLCLSSDSHGGYQNIEQAYAKSVLWAKGFSEFLRTGKFPF